MNASTERHPNIVLLVGALAGFLIGFAAFHTVQWGVFVMVGALAGPSGWRWRLWRARRSA